MTKEKAIQELKFILVGHPETSARGQAVLMAIEALKQPEQKKGKWIVTGMFDDFLKCSCCAYRKPWNQDIFNFCPNCGAEMRKRNENKP